MIVELGSVTQKTFGTIAFYVEADDCSSTPGNVQQC